MNTQSLIAIYRTGFYISMLLALIGAAMAGLMFVKFNIRTIWEIRTGRAKRQSILQMEQSSRKEGWMRKESTPAASPSSIVSTNSEEMTRTEDLGPVSGAHAARYAPSTETMPLEPKENPASADQDETEPLDLIARTHFVLTQQIVITHCDDVIA